MSPAGYDKFDYTKMDLYRFLCTFEEGCERIKYDNEQKMSSFLFYMNEESQKIYFEVRVQQAPAE